MNSKNKKCEVCFGSGADLGAGDEFDEPCWACGGSGSDHIDDKYIDPESSMKSSFGDKEVCPKCFGVGEIKDEFNHPSECHACDGVGYIDLGEEKVVGQACTEGFGFDKFMDSTLIMEQKKVTVNAKTVSPQRQLARGYQEHPLGKIRMGGK